MGHIVIATPERVDAGTLTGLGTIAASLPVVNLQTMQPGKVCRWLSLGAVGLRCDLGTAPSVNLVAFGPHNGSATAHWRVRAGVSESEADAGAGYDSGMVPMWPAGGRPSGYDGVMLWSLLWLGAAVQPWRFWRIDVHDETNPAGYFQAGRLVIDAAWQPTRNLRYGWGLGWDDPSETVRAIGGQTWAVERNRGRILEFTLGSMREHEMMENAYELARKRGKARDLLVVRDPDASTHLHRQMVHGLMTELPPLVNRHFRLFETGYRIAELPI
jgi:hypothetical protein